MVGAGLEGDVRRGSAHLRRVAAGGQGVRLRVAIAGAHVPALAQDPPVAGDHAADDRIGPGGSPPALREGQGALEEALVLGGHLSAGAGSRAATSCRKASAGEGWW